MGSFCSLDHLHLPFSHTVSPVHTAPVLTLIFIGSLVFWVLRVRGGGDDVIIGGFHVLFAREPAAALRRR
jgi:hypothetical protein